MGLNYYYEGTCDFCKKHIDERQIKDKPLNFHGFSSINIPILIKYPNETKIQYDSNHTVERYNYHLAHFELCSECAKNLAKILYNHLDIYAERFMG